MATKDDPWLSVAVRDLLIDSELSIKTNPDLTKEEVVENVLRKFNEDDENGVGLEIRELISKELENDIIYEVDDILKRFKNNFDSNSGSNFKTIEDEVVKRVRVSGNFKFVTKNLQENVEKVTEKLTTSNFDLNSLKIQRKNPLPVEKTTKLEEKRIISLYSDVDSLNASFDISNFDNFDNFPSFGNLGNFVYLEWEKFVNLTEKCAKSNPDIEERINSMNLLIKFVNPQFIDKSSMERLIPVLRDALTSGNLILAENCLKFYWKIISSNYHSAVIDLFLNLLDFVKHEYQNREIEISILIPFLDDGISVENVNSRILLMIFRVIHRFLMNIVRDWVRFPNNEIEMVVVKTLNLILIGNTRLKSGKIGKRDVVTPFHLFAILDPSGKWLKRWMKSGYGRSVILEKFNWMKLMNCLVSWLGGYFSDGNSGNFHQSLLKREKIDNNLDISISKSENFQRIPSQSGNSQRSLPSSANFHHQMSSKSENFQQISPKIGNSKRTSPKRTNFQQQIENSHQNWHFSYENLQFSHCYFTIETLGLFYLYKKQFKPNIHFPSTTLPNSFITFLTQHLYTTCCCNNNNFKKYCLGHCISSILTNLIKTENNLTPPILTNDVINDICTPLISNSSSEINLLTCCRLLTTCLENENCSKIVLESEIIEKIQKFTLKIIKNENFSIFSEIFVSYLNVCSKIYANYSSVDLFLETKFPEILYSRLRVLIGNVENEEKCENQLKCLAQFAATPKGLRKLDQIGALHECVSCLIGDYQDLQNENNLLLKISQINNTLTLIDKHGFFISIVSNFYQDCEDVNTEPHLENIERITDTQIDNLLPYISPLTTMTSLLRHSKRHVLTWPPRCLQDLLKCVVFADDFESRENEICNLEKFEYICLRLLSGLVCSLDSNLILQSLYQYQDKIIKLQVENKIADEGRIIIDENSLLRHNILVKSRCVGGPNEKMAPIYEIPRFGSSVPYPILNDNQTSDYYLPQRLSRDKNIDDRNPLITFLNETKSAKISVQTWIRLCSQAFQECLIKDYNCEQTLFKAMNKLAEMNCSTLTDFTQQHSTLAYDDLSDVYKLGIELTIRYGNYLNINNLDDVSKTELTRFVTTYQQNWIKKSNNDSFPWLPVTIYLMSNVDCDNTLHYLDRIKQFNPNYTWLMFPNLENDPISKWTWICHQIEEMLNTELPCVYSAFQLGSGSISGISLIWLRNYFWNYLDWDEICNFVMLFTTMGINYVIFYVTAIFSHLQYDVLTKSQKSELNTFLLEEPLHGFKLQTYFPYLNYLSEKYNAMLTNSLEKYLKLN